ncbi:hypothetical protein NC652_028968 [Populus alba x Populus x berolinensis]|nr:hypothetical protein NC652_028968 [Populus alba x Populus x berolinensis]
MVFFAPGLASKRIECSMPVLGLSDKQVILLVVSCFSPHFSCPSSVIPPLPLSSSLGLVQFYVFYLISDPSTKPFPMMITGRLQFCYDPFVTMDHPMLVSPQCYSSDNTSPVISWPVPVALLLRKRKQDDPKFAFNIHKIMRQLCTIIKTIQNPLQAIISGWMKNIYWILSQVSAPYIAKVHRFMKPYKT